MAWCVTPRKNVDFGLAAVAVASVFMFTAIFSAAFGKQSRRVEWLGAGIGMLGGLLLNLGGDLPSGCACAEGAACW